MQFRSMAFVCGLVMTAGLAQADVVAASHLVSPSGGSTIGIGFSPETGSVRGQSFTSLADGTLSSVSVLSVRYGGVLQDLRMEFFVADSVTGLPGLFLGQVVKSAGSISESLAMNAFDFSSLNIQLAAGSTYAFVLSVDQGTPDGAYAMAGDSSRTYDGGEGLVRYFDGNALAYGMSGMDYIFEATVIPAPGAAALLGLGGLMATRRRR